MRGSGKNTTLSVGKKHDLMAYSMRALFFCLCSFRLILVRHVQRCRFCAVISFEDNDCGRFGNITRVK